MVDVQTLTNGDFNIDCNVNDVDFHSSGTIMTNFSRPKIFDRSSKLFCLILSAPIPVYNLSSSLLYLYLIQKKKINEIKNILLIEAIHEPIHIYKIRVLISLLFFRSSNGSIVSTYKFLIYTTI